MQISFKSWFQGQLVPAMRIRQDEIGCSKARIAGPGAQRQAIPCSEIEPVSGYPKCRLDGSPIIENNPPPHIGRIEVGLPAKCNPLILAVSRYVLGYQKSARQHADSRKGDQFHPRCEPHAIRINSSIKRTTMAISSSSPWRYQRKAAIRSTAPS